MAKRHRYKPWRPFVQPTHPPPGSYDPALDASVRASGRGYGDLQQDTGLSDQRAGDDYQIAQNRLNEQRGNTLADLLRSYTTGNEDRQKSYTVLGSNQNQSANAAGLLGGGFAEQAAQKRAANQKLEQDRADTEYNTTTARVNTATDEDLASLGLDYSRGVTDRGTALTRAGRENTFYGADVNASAWAQAKASGVPLPTKPAGEGFRVGTGGQKIYFQRKKGGATLTSGRFLRSSALRSYLRRKGVR